MLIVTTDRLSAFDVIMNEPIPNKGRVLTQMSLICYQTCSELGRLASLSPNLSICFKMDVKLLLCPTSSRLASSFC